MPQDTIHSGKSFEDVIARICGGMLSEPELFERNVCLQLATSESKFTTDPASAKSACIMFYGTKDAVQDGSGNPEKRALRSGIVVVNRKDGGGASIECKRLPHGCEVYPNAIWHFIWDREEPSVGDAVGKCARNGAARSRALSITRAVFWISLALSVIAFFAFFPLLGEDSDLGYAALALLIFFLAVLVIDYSYLYYGLEEPVIGDRGFAESLGKAGGYAVLGIIVLAVLIVLGTCAMGGGGSSKSHSTEETAEFLTNIDTPGTSEYKWYHDEYLPDNDLPDR